MLAFLLWCFLFILCWPVALLALILYPFIGCCCFRSDW